MGAVLTLTAAAWLIPGGAGVSWRLSRSTRDEAEAGIGRRGQTGARTLKLISRPMAGIHPLTLLFALLMVV